MWNDDDDAQFFSEATIVNLQQRSQLFAKG